MLVPRVPMPTLTATALQVAQVLGVRKSTVIRRAQTEGWSYTEEPGRGGMRRLYQVDHLPATLRAKLQWRGVAADATPANKLFDDAAQSLDFPAVEVTAVPEAGAVDELLRMPSLSRLEIVLTPPNADDADDLEERLLERLEAQRAKRMVETYFAKRNETLIPDDSTKALAHVAARNGKVTAYGKDAQGLPLADSTANRPLLRSVHVDDDLETTSQVLSRVADDESP